MKNSEIKELIKKQKINYPLDQPFYVDDEIFKLDLKNGFNVVDFVALNQGTSGPNTAEIIVYDDQGKLVGTNRWNLATGVKATYIIYKN